MLYQPHSAVLKVIIVIPNVDFSCDMVIKLLLALPYDILQ